LQVQSRSNIADEVRSYLSRELRNLKGVTIVEDKDADYTIGVIVFPVHNKAGYNTGYAFSVLVTQPGGYQRVRDIIERHSDEKALKTLDAAAKDSVEIVHHSLETGSELEKTCHSLVADLDGAVLEPARKIDQTLKDALEKP